jgi:hypothetical protein
MTTLITCSNIAEAQLLKSLLDDSGIRAYLPEEFTANAAPQFLFSSGIRLQVEDEDADEARRVIAAAEAPPDETGAQNQPR